MPDTKIVVPKITGGNPAPSLQYPVVNLAGLIDGMESVPDTASLMPPYHGQPGLADSNAFADLAFYRAEFPFVPIMPLPMVVTKLLAANAPQEINMPSGTVLARFQGTGDFWLSWRDTARVPVAGADANSPVSGSAVYNPTGIWFYVNHVRQISVLSQGVCFVQAWCIAYKPIPKRQSA